MILDQAQLEMTKIYLAEGGHAELVPTKGVMAGAGHFYLTCKKPNGETVRVELTFGADPKDRAKVKILK